MSPSRALRVVPLFATLLFVFLWTNVAMAEPVSWQRGYVTLFPDQSSGVLLVSGELPETTPLPAEAELSVPTGTSLQWIGEILGGDPSADPELQYTKSTVDGSDVYRFTLTKSHIAQVEVLDGGTAGFDGTNYTAGLKWSATQAIPEVQLSVRIPQSAQIVQSVPEATVQPGGSGYNYYSKTVKEVKPGDQLDLALSYRMVAASASGTTTTPSNSTAQFIMILIAVAAGGFFIVAIRRKVGARSGHAVTSAAPSIDEDEPDTVTSVKVDDGNAGSEMEPVRTPVETETTSDPGSTVAARRNIATAVIIGSIIVAAFVISNQTTKPQIEGDTISQAFSQAAPCATASIALAVPSGADPATTAETLFAALGAVGGVDKATYNFKTSTLEVGFCESKTTEEGVRRGLAPTGLVEAVVPPS